MAERLADVLDLPAQERGDFIRSARRPVPAVAAGDSVVEAPVAEGAVFVSLVAISTAAEMPSAIANGLNVPLAGESNPIVQIDALLAGRALLLVLDNFEHLLTPELPSEEAAVTLIDHVVQHIPTVQLLITSRERLRVAGEQVLELGGLNLPSAQTGDVTESDAVLLFLQRARQVSPAFAVTPANRCALVQLCALLGGMPLGIELASAWVRVLTLDEIVAEMTRSIDFLTLADRTAPPRHRSLRAVFEHSWKLLSPEERAIAARFAVFRDGFSREAAQTVVGAGLAQLAAFVDKSLVRTTTEAGPDSSLDAPRHLRYTIHELLRQFLALQLQSQGAEQAANCRHAEYFTALAERVEPHLYADMTPAWLYQLEIEQGDIRAALEWCIVQANDPMLGLRLAGSMGPYWYLVGAWQEGRDWLQLALNLLGWAQLAQGNFAAANANFHEAGAMGRRHANLPLVGWSLRNLGIAHYRAGEPEEAAGYLRACLRIYQQIGYKSGTLIAFEVLAAVSAEQGRVGDAVRWLAVADQLRTTTGQPRTGTDEKLDYQRTVQITQAALGADGWQAVWQAGAHLSLEEANALALAA